MEMRICQKCKIHGFRFANDQKYSLATREYYGTLIYSQAVQISAFILKGANVQQVHPEEYSAAIDFFFYGISKIPALAQAIYNLIKRIDDLNKKIEVEEITFVLNDLEAGKSITELTNRVLRLEGK
jgi:hypothetical protein